MIEIVKKEFQPVGSRLRLEMRLSDSVPYGWANIYDEAIRRVGTYTSMRAFGGPVIDQVEFLGNRVVTADFPESAASEVKDFLVEFEKVLAIANSICENRKEEQKRKLMEAERKKREQQEKIDELNKWLNDKDK